MVILHRERLPLHIDSWVYPETADQREALAAAAGAVALAGRVATVRRTVTETVWNGCGSPATLLIAPDPEAEAHDFRTPDANITPLSRASTIANVLETTGGSLPSTSELPAMPAERTTSSCFGA